MAFNIVIQNIEQYANLAAFPAAGNSNILYIDEATSTAYFWDGAAYSSVSGGAGGSVDRADLVGLEQITGPIITPPTLTGNVDDYNPTGFSTCNLIRQEINSNNRQITGFLAPAVGVNRIIYITNISGAGDDLKFMNNNAGSLVANRILLRDNGDKTIRPNETGAFYYDHIQDRWISFNRIG